MAGSKPAVPAAKPAHTRGVASAFNRAFGGPTFKLLALAAMIGALAVGSKSLWEHVGPHTLANPEYRVRRENVHLTPPPEWIRSDLRTEIWKTAGLREELSLLDDDLCERLAKAVALHPWVAEVARVEKSYPARVDVTVVYREPVCMIEVPGGLYPLSADGVLLPSGDFSPIEARRYPRIAGLAPRTAGPVGTRWQDASVRGASALAGVLRPHWLDLQLDRIEPAAGGTDDEPRFQLYTLRGSRIQWGRPPEAAAADESTAAEPSAAEKLAWLLDYVSRHDSLDGPDGPQELDLPRLVRPVPHTAELPR